MDYSAKWEDLVSNFGYGFIDDEEQYKIIVKGRAYFDMQPRTIDGLEEFRKEDYNNKKLNDIFDGLAYSLYSFITSEDEMDVEEFDKWHKKLCENFCEEFNKLTEGAVKPISFGKAQKLVNVSLKYIYCLKGAEKYVSKFRHCHMILDRYTYSEGFYVKKVIPWLNDNCDCKSNGIKKSALTSWSNLEYEEYDAIQNNIRKFLAGTSKYVDASGNKLTPFQAEFYIFNEYSNKQEG